MAITSHIELHNQKVHVVEIPESIRKTGIPTPEIIAEGVSYFHRDGIIILNNAIDHEHIDKLNSILSSEAEEIASRPGHHFNFGKQTRNIDQAPPPVPDLMFKDIWANPFAAGILSAILGPRPVVTYANGNTALKATGRQPVHSDCEFAHPLFPFAMVVNINLVDTSPKNGGTEVWIGSHTVSTVDEHVSEDDGEGLLSIKQEHLDERAKHSPPIQISSKKGSIILRDLRLWHAGMPNQTDDPRVMLAFVVQPEWYQAKGKITLPESARSLVESWKDELQFAANYVEGEVDHKTLKSASGDFTSGNPKMAELESLMHKSPY